MNVWTYLLYRWKNIIFVYNFYLLGLLKNFIMIRGVVRGKKRIQSSELAIIDIFL